LALVSYLIGAKAIHSLSSIDKILFLQNVRC